MQKRAISNIVATLFLVLFVIMAVAVVLFFLKDILIKETEKASSCFQNKDKITLSNSYTCYNSTSNEFYFSLNIGDVDIDKVIILIDSVGETKSFELTNDLIAINGLRYLSGNYLNPVKLPERESGKVYSVDLLVIGFSNSPDYVSISPFINGENCKISDSTNEIYECSSISEFYS